VNALRVTALVASILCLAVLVSPAGASGPVLAPAAAPAVDGPSVTAMGVGLVQPSAVDPLAIVQTLYITVQSNVELGGVQSAADDLMARLDAIKAALVKVGVPAEGIRTAGLNVNPGYGPAKPGAAPFDKGQPTGPGPVTSLNLAGTLTADVPSVRILVAAMNAATANGATQVNANGGKGGGPYGSVQPSAADLAKGAAAAVANARTNAEALATASGKKLGGIRSITSQMPMMGCCPPNSGWTVQVTVTFDFAP
jgi:uncharacterized protein YggE